jgi:hypothetical protein
MERKTPTENIVPEIQIFRIILKVLELYLSRQCNSLMIKEESKANAIRIK